MQHISHFEDVEEVRKQQILGAVGRVNLSNTNISIEELITELTVC